MDEDTVIMSMEDFADMQVREPPSRKIDERIPVLEYSLDGVFIRSFSHAREAALFHHSCASYIGNICRGKYLYFHRTNTTFIHRGDDITDRLKKIADRMKGISVHATKVREVYEYTLGEKLLFKYPTAKIAAQVNKLKTFLVYGCCKGKRLFVGKRIFLYEDGDIKQRVREVKSELYRLSNKRPKYREVDEYTLDGQFVKGYPSASAAGRELV